MQEPHDIAAEGDEIGRPHQESRKRHQELKKRHQELKKRQQEFKKRQQELKYKEEFDGKRLISPAKFAPKRAYNETPDNNSSFASFRQKGALPQAQSIPSPYKPDGLDRSKKPQCWDHGCNGRVFITSSSLLAHQREIDGASTKKKCPRCGATFTQITALQGHLAHERCKFSQSNSGYDQDDPKARKNAEMAASYVETFGSIPPSGLFDKFLESDEDSDTEMQNDSTLINPLALGSEPLIERYDDTRDTKLRLSAPNAEGQAPSQSHNVAAPDNALAETLHPFKYPELPPRPSSSTFRDSKATQPKSNAPADANAKAGEAGTYARYEIAKADENSAESRVNAIDEFARAGERSKDSEFDGARRENTSPSLKNVKPSEEYGQDTPKDDFPKDDSPKDDSLKNDSPRDNSLKDDALKDDFPKDDSPKKNAPDQIKDEMLKSSSTQPESQNLPARPRRTYNVPTAVPQTQSDFDKVIESSQHSRINHSNAARFLARPSLRVSRP